MEICYLHDVVTVYGCIVSTYVTSNDEYSSNIRNTPFHSCYIPPLTIKGFMERIYKYFNCSAECYLLSLIYIDRLIRLDSFVINGYSVYRVVLTSLMLAAKFFDDVYFTNAFYADVGGIRVDELNMLEVDFLCRIRFNLNVTPQDYYHYYLNICDHCTALCRNCSSIRLPTIINCTPYEETPLLRFHPHYNLSPFASTASFASNWFSSTNDYRTPTVLDSCFSNAQSMDYNSANGYASKYYSNNQGYYSNQVYVNPYPRVVNYPSNRGYGKSDMEDRGKMSLYPSVEGNVLYPF